MDGERVTAVVVEAAEPTQGDRLAGAQRRAVAEAAGRRGLWTVTDTVAGGLPRHVARGVGELVGPREAGVGLVAERAELDVGAVGRLRDVGGQGVAVAPAQSNVAKPCWPRVVAIVAASQTGAWLVTSTLKLTFTLPPSLSWTRVRVGALVVAVGVVVDGADPS